MTRTYAKVKTVETKIERIEYELKVYLDGTFGLHVWVWDEDGDITRSSDYDLTRASLLRLTRAIGTHQGEGWLFKNSSVIMEVEYVRYLS